MKNLKTYHQLFENSQELTPEQIEWLDSCTPRGTWALNPQTGLVDVDGYFNCSGQDLVDFKGVGFRVIKGSFNCENNKLTSLEGAPQVVEVNFYCNNNLLTSLEGAPQVVGKDFFCHHNPVSNKTLSSIFSLMKKGKSNSTLTQIRKSKSYLEAVESLWDKIPSDDQELLYRPEFKWTKPEAIRALAHFNRIKGMI
jgi:hypothetical protein